MIVYLQYFFQFKISTLLADYYLMFCKNLKNMSPCYIELTMGGVCDIISRSVVILDLLD